MKGKVVREFSAGACEMKKFLECKVLLPGCTAAPTSDSIQRSGPYMKGKVMREFSAGACEMKKF